MILTGETEVLGEKPVTMPLCPPHKAALSGIEPGRPNVVYRKRGEN